MTCKRLRIKWKKCKCAWCRRTGHNWNDKMYPCILFQIKAQFYITAPPKSIRHRFFDSFPLYAPNVIERNQKNSYWHLSSWKGQFHWERIMSYHLLRDYGSQGESHGQEPSKESKEAPGLKGHSSQKARQPQTFHPPRLFCPSWIPMSLSTELPGQRCYSSFWSFLLSTKKITFFFSFGEGTSSFIISIDMAHVGPEIYWRPCWRLGDDSWAHPGPILLSQPNFPDLTGTL